jgi:hypothetical protein
MLREARHALQQLICSDELALLQDLEPRCCECVENRRSRVELLGYAHSTSQLHLLLKQLTSRR